MFIQRFVRLPPVHISYAVRLSGLFNVPKWYCVMYRSGTREIDMYRNGPSLYRTEVDMYRNGPPLCTEMDMYRYGPTTGRSGLDLGSGLELGTESGIISIFLVVLTVF